MLGKLNLLKTNTYEKYSFQVVSKKKNIYIFQSSYKHKNHGTNNSSPNIIKKIKLKNQISVNLFGDQIYKEKI